MFTIRFLTVREAFRTGVLKKLKTNKILVALANREAKIQIEKITAEWNIEVHFVDTYDEILGSLEKESINMLIAFCGGDKNRLQSIIQKAVSNNITCSIITDDNEVRKGINYQELVRFLPLSFTPSDLFESILDAQVEKTKVIRYSDLKLKGSKRLLLVEDNPTNQMVLSNILKKYGFTLDLAVNGAEAVEKVRNNTFDIVMMDIQMPVMNGHEATRKIREFNPNIPIVALSAAVLDNDKKLSKLAGMNDHIGKPFIHEEFIEALSHYFEFEQRSDNKEPAKSKPGVPIKGKLDLDYLRQTLGLNESEIVAILKSFRSNYADLDEQLPKLTENSEMAKKYFHALKGEAGNLGLKSIYEIVSLLENSYSPAVRPTLLGEFAESMKELFAEIDLFLKISKDTQKKLDSDNSQAETLLLQTIENLENSVFLDQSEVELLIDSLEKKRSEKTLESLRSDLENLNYHSALVKLNEIRSSLI